MIDYSQILSAMNQGGGGMTPKQGYTLANGTPVLPATPVTPGKGVPDYGGQNMAMPAGSTPIQAPGTQYAGAAASLISGLADAYTQYAAAKAIKAPKITPDYAPVAFQPQTAQLPLANIGTPQQFRG